MFINQNCKYAILETNDVFHKDGYLLIKQESKKIYTLIDKKVTIEIIDDDRLKVGEYLHPSIAGNMVKTITITSKYIFSHTNGNVYEMAANKGELVIKQVD